MDSADTPESTPKGSRPAVYALGMTVSAHDVARTIRGEQPGIGVKKLHKLLYLCQGHHLAMTGSVMFHEEVNAYEMGPVVARLWGDEKAGRDLPPVDLDQGKLNTVGYVLSRYGALSGRDLEHLSHGQDPWRAADAARASGGADVIDVRIMASYFSETEDEDDLPWPEEADIRAWLAGATRRRQRPSPPDDVERLRARARAR